MSSLPRKIIRSLIRSVVKSTKRDIIYNDNESGGSILFSSAPRIMIMGDSRQQYASHIFNVVAPDYGCVESRFLNGWTIAQAILGNFYGPMDSVWPLESDERDFDGANQGVSTKDSTWVAANRYSKIATLNPNACSIQVGINNGGLSGIAGSPGTGDEEIETHIAAFVATCNANGTVPIIETVLPSTSGASKQKPDAINKILRDTYAAQHGKTLIFIDGANYLMGTPYGFMSLSDMPDMLHLGYKGAQRYGEYIASVMAPFITAPNWLTTNSYSNIIPNSTLSGSSGVAGARVTGTIPNNWQVHPEGGSYNSTVVVSIGTDAISGQPVMHLDITPVDNASHQDFLYIRPKNDTYGEIVLGTAGTLTDNEYINAALFILPSNDVDIQEVSPSLLMIPDTWPKRQGFGGINMANGTVAGERRQWICTPVVKLDSTGTGVQVFYRIKFNVATGASPFRVSMLMPRFYDVTGRQASWGSL